MAATNLETANRCRINSPRDLEDASEVSVADLTAQADPTDGATFLNTGGQLLCFTYAGGGSETEVYHILRNGVNSEYTGLDVGDDAGNAYDVVTVPANDSEQGAVFVGPFDPNRYNDSAGLLTVKAVTSVDAVKLAVVDIRSRRTARSTSTR